MEVSAENRTALASRALWGAEHNVKCFQDLTQSQFDEIRDRQQELGLNPASWEWGHSAFFWDVFFLRQLLRVDNQSEAIILGKIPQSVVVCRPASAASADVLVEDWESDLVLDADENAGIARPANEIFDSFSIPHAYRFQMALPSKSEVLRYKNDIAAIVQELLLGDLSLKPLLPGATLAYLCTLATAHENMHSESLLWTRQRLGLSHPVRERVLAGRLHGDRELATGKARDVHFEACLHQLGAHEADQFVFDNEKWGHEVAVGAFSMSSRCVTVGEYLEFLLGGGYDRRDWWCLEGWLWKQTTQVSHPMYWRERHGRWEMRFYDEWIDLAEVADWPMIYVSWYEASAYCRSVNRRLPSEAEWEVAASSHLHRGNDEPRPEVPWTDDERPEDHANLIDNENAAFRPVPVTAFRDGQKRTGGLSQMLGNVWEWTSDAFYPFPGFVPDLPYREYSAPWFGYNKILKGGSWASPRQFVRIGFRNFFLPQRCDVPSGFRTCAND